MAAVRTRNRLFKQRDVTKEPFRGRYLMIKANQTKRGHRSVTVSSNLRGNITATVQHHDLTTHVSLYFIRCFFIYLSHLCVKVKVLFVVDVNSTEERINDKTNLLQDGRD